MTVEEMLCRMPYKELRLWQAYEAVAGPLGPRRGDYQAAMVARSLAQVFSKRRLDLTRFLFKWSRADKKSGEGDGSNVRNLFDSDDAPTDEKAVMGGH